MGPIADPKTSNVAPDEGGGQAFCSQHQELNEIELARTFGGMA